MIGIIGAMQLETEAFIGEMEQTQTRVISGIPFVRGRFMGQETVVATSGVGKVFAAICAEIMILTYHPAVVINTGVAGGLLPALSILDVTIASGVVQHDLDTSPLGDPKGLISGIDRIVLPADPLLSLGMRKAAQKLGITLQEGVVASGDQFIADEGRKAAIRTQFGAIACEMEGAAIGQVCYVNRVPFCVLRTVSDTAENAAQMDYPTFARKAAEQSFLLLKKWMEEQAT